LAKNDKNQNTPLSGAFAHRRPGVPVTLLFDSMHSLELIYTNPIVPDHLGDEIERLQGWNSRMKK